MSVRTPEETARLANGVTVETPSGTGRITPVVCGPAGGEWVSHAVMPGIDKEQALVYLAADLAETTAKLAGACLAIGIANKALAEARAEVVALRPKAEAAERWARANDACEHYTPREGGPRWSDVQQARIDACIAIIDACPEKGGAG